MSIIFLLSISLYILLNPSANAVTSGKFDVQQNPDTALTIFFNNETGKNKIQIPASKILFKVVNIYDKSHQVQGVTFKLQPAYMPLYKKVGFSKPSDRVVFVYPIFTQAAYEANGFYSYYAKKCDTKCLTVPIPSTIAGKYTSSSKAMSILTLLNYSHITDVDIDKDPNILKKYDKVIILHNEYVTQKEFDAITHHPNVVYLYPNALYAKVSTNYDKNTLTLIRGHGYPNTSIRNGFDWKNDNSKYEYDFYCDNWSFSKITNGAMLNCYPEFRILYDDLLLQIIRN